MAVCTLCNQEMKSARSCSVAVLHRDRKPIPMRPHRGSGRCGDCGVTRGGFHHLGCDLQRCPVCKGQMLSCGCRFDEDGPLGSEDDAMLGVADPFDGGFFVDSNGCLAERKTFGGREIIVHYDDVPESDITTVDGIRVTTPLRTVIDLAPQLDADELERMVEDCLRRRLFSLEDARARLGQPDMRLRPGAVLLRRLFGF